MKKEIWVFPPSYSFTISCSDCAHKSVCPSVGYVCRKFVPNELCMGQKITPKVLDSIYERIREAEEASDSSSESCA